MTPPVDLGSVPDQPQKRRLVATTEALWRDETVAALWLGGSFARGVADEHSDVDLRVAVRPDAFDAEQVLHASGLGGAAVGKLSMPFGDDALLHHLLLDDGDIYDLWVQTTERPPGEETRLVLACRDEAFGAKLAAPAEDPAVRFPPADAGTARDLLVNFWIGQRKHQKVLFRGLDLLATEGEHRLRQDVVRLWYMLTTGDDCGPVAGLTIHTFSPVERALRAAPEHPHAGLMALLGLPLRTQDELIAATAALQDEVSRVGRALADRLGFPYPDDLEHTVRESWRRFLGTT